MVVNITKISQKIKEMNWLSIEKKRFFITIKKFKKLITLKNTN